MRICTVLKSGPEYRPEHAIWLAEQIHRHNPQAEIICLTDTDLNHPLIKAQPLKHPWRGWWSKLNLFDDEQVPGDVFYLDIDTCVVGPLQQLVSRDHTTMLRDFYRQELPASGVMFIHQRDKAKIWKKFNEDPAKWMARCTTRAHWGDQGFYRFCDIRPRFWQEDLPNKVFSYKVHNLRRNYPASAALVCFHGKPRPWESGAAWVPSL